MSCIIFILFYCLFSDISEFLHVFESTERVPWLLFDLQMSTQVHTLLTLFSYQDTSSKKTVHSQEYLNFWTFFLFRVMGL